MKLMDDLFQFQIERPSLMNGANGVLCGLALRNAVAVICSHHYTHSVPSGKSHYFRFEDALVVWSIPANNNIAKFILGWEGKAWELSRLWAPDGHAKNLLTRAISAAVSVIKRLENPDVLVSYADPNAGHSGGIYRAASWMYHGSSDESRGYQDSTGKIMARRAFHSGGNNLSKVEIESMGYVQVKAIGKERFVKPLSRRAKKALRGNP